MRKPRSRAISEPDGITSKGNIQGKVRGIVQATQSREVAMLLKMTKCLIGAAVLSAFAVLPASAQQGLDEPFQASFKQALAGKTVGYIPVAMNFDLTEGWFAGVKKELEPYGMKVIVRDADRKSTRLNSSHSSISYAVFCLKKKKIRRMEITERLN